MKKLIYGASFLLMAIVFNSCAKVTSTETIQIDIQSSAWVPNGTSGQSNYLYYASYSVSAITSDVVNNGAVLCYRNLGSQWAPLPFTETYNGYQVNYNFQYEAGYIFFVRKDSDLLTIPPAGTITMKVVILSQKDMHLLDGVDTNNYLEVAEALNLEK